MSLFIWIYDNAIENNKKLYNRLGTWRPPFELFMNPNNFSLALAITKKKKIRCLCVDLIYLSINRYVVPLGSYHTQTVYPMLKVNTLLGFILLHYSNAKELMSEI
jgi:hypothetical protein